MNILTNLDLNKNQIFNFALQNLSVAPTGAVPGQVYFNTASNALQVYDGTRWLVGGIADIPEFTIENVIGLSEALNNKLETSVFNTHDNNAIKHITAGERSAWNGKWDYSESTIKAVKVNSALNSDKTNGFTLGMNVPAGSKLTDTVLVESVNGEIGAVVLTAGDINISGSDTTSISTKIGTLSSGITALETDKVDKIAGKGLSTKDFTDALETKLTGITVGATKVENSLTNGNIKINGTEATVYSHPGTGTNPHGTTKADVGLGNVTNNEQATKVEFDAHTGNATVHITGPERTAWNAKETPGAAQTKATQALTDAKEYTDLHTALVNNPHAVTKAQVGLVNVENKSSATIRSEITGANVTTALGYTPLNSTLKGAKSGLAELDDSGYVPASQLPSYVDDVLEYANFAALPTTGETGKIYVTQNDNIIFRWSGTAYVEISSSLALGTTSSTAYAGDKGKIAYDHSQIAHAPSNAQKNSDITKAEIEAKLTGVIASHSHTVTKANVGLANVDNTSDLLKPISTATQAALDNKMSTSERVNYMRRYTSPIGNGTATTYTVSHNLGTKFVTVSLYDTVSGEEVWTDITRTTDNAVKIDFADKVALNKYTVVVIG